MQMGNAMIIGFRLSALLAFAFSLAGCAATHPMQGVTKAGPRATALEQCNEVAAGYREFSCELVLFSTNREELIIPDQTPLEPVNLGPMFGIVPDPDCEPQRPVRIGRTETEQSPYCHMGAVAIGIPDIRQDVVRSGGGGYDSVKTVGKLSPKDLRTSFTILGYQNLDTDGFSEILVDTLSDAKLTPGHTLVFVHGFNVPFLNAAYRTAQIKYDMGFDGPVAFFSWPANGRTEDYFNDLEDADLSVDVLARFLRYVNETTKSSNPDAQVHIIAHSMGSRVLSQALTQLAREDDAPKFGEVFFAAGDLDRNLFKEWMAAGGNIVDGVTIYASDDDGALFASRFFRNVRFLFGQSKDPKGRIGVYRKSDGRPFVYDLSIEGRQSFRIDTIDMSRLGSNPWQFFDVNRWFKKNHDKYAGYALITDDMLAAICNNDADNGYRPMPHERSVGRIDQTSDYWVAQNIKLPPERSIRRGCLPE